MIASAATADVPQARIHPARVFSYVLVCFGILIATNGFIVGGLTVFDSRMIAELGTGVAGIRLRDTVTVVTLGLTVPFAGWLLDRFPVRPVLAAGLIAMAIAFLAYGQVTALWQIYVLHVLLGFSQATAGVVACVYLVSGWTRTHRGMALGFLIAGSSFGNAIVPAFNTFLLGYQPWRQAVLGGAAIALLLLPLVFLVVREPCRSVATADPERAGRVDHRFVDTLVSRDFLVLGSIAAITVFCVLAVATNLALFAERGSSGGASGPMLLFALFGSAVAAQLLAGVATYRCDTSLVHRLAIAVMLAGAIVFAAAPPGFAIAAAALFGTGWGANSTMLQVRPTQLFGGPMLGRVLAALAVAETIGGGSGPVLSGWIAQRSGSFTTAFVAVAALLVLPLILSFFSGRKSSSGAAALAPASSA